jgi:hypothetical protein
MDADRCHSRFEKGFTIELSELVKYFGLYSAL